MGPLARDYPLLYLKQPNAGSLPGFACSEIDIRKVDQERFTLYRFAYPLQVEIAAGETLYLPAGWSHCVEALSSALMVNSGCTVGLGPRHAWKLYNRERARKANAKLFAAICRRVSGVVRFSVHDSRFLTPPLACTPKTPPK